MKVMRTITTTHQRSDRYEISPRSHKLRVMIAASVFVACQAFAATISSPEQPVSDRLFSAGAANYQTTLAIASNGQIGFAMWLDYRRGGAGEVYGSRLDANGTPLDPLGILLPRSATSVVWNGSAFAVVGGSTMTFVAADGTILGQKSLAGFYSLIAPSGSGPAVRLLFASGSRGVITDGVGNVIASNVELWPSNLLGVTLRFGGGSDSDFLVFYTWLGADYFVSRIDANGQRLASSDSGIATASAPFVHAVTGDANGYLLAAMGPNNTGVTAYHLDRSGVVTGTEALDFRGGSFLPQGNMPLSVTRGSQGYAVAWTTIEGSIARANVARVLPAGGVSVRQTAQWTGVAYGAFVTPVAGRDLFVFDAFRQGSSTSIDPLVQSMSESLGDETAPQPVATTAAAQQLPQVASSLNGYAVVWNEIGPDANVHLFVRRFSSGAAPLDAPFELASYGVPTEVATATIEARIAATADTYVVAWASVSSGSSSPLFIRRMAASTGVWLDDAPVPLTTGTLQTLGSNGTTALAVYTTTPCDASCTRARSIAMDPGAPLTSTEKLLPPGIRLIDPTIASNGHDYLMVFESNHCLGIGDCDVLSSYRMLGLRLDADGTLPDTTPFFVDAAESVPTNPSVVWNGKGYVVSWEALGLLKASHVSAGGVVTDAGHTVTDAMGVVTSEQLVANGTQLFLTWTRKVNTDSAAIITEIDPELLNPIGSPTTIAVGSNVITGAAQPGGFVAAYDRIDTPGGNVPRVFSRIIAGSSARRRSSR
jgi:hypothetical protein